MDIQVAEKKMIEYLEELKNKKSYNFTKAFKECLEKHNNKPNDQCYAKQEVLPDGSHLFIINEKLLENNVLLENCGAIVIKTDGTALDIHGACADLYIDNKSTLGNPLTGERWIGSGPGRYQQFQSGLIKYEGAYKENIAHAVIFESTYTMPPISVTGFVAFIDIRGFTKWSQENTPEMQHKLLSALETILQKYFDRDTFKNLFIKGTGDGFMVVQEEYKLIINDIITRTKTKESVTVEDFINACLDCCKDMALLLKNDGYKLSVGLGVDVGELLNCWILGRWDYIGDAVNNASKLQTKANNEVIISKKCYDQIKDKSIYDKRCTIESHSFVLKPI